MIFELLEQKFSGKNIYWTCCYFLNHTNAILEYLNKFRETGKREIFIEVAQVYLIDYDYHFMKIKETFYDSSEDFKKLNNLLEELSQHMLFIAKDVRVDYHLAQSISYLKDVQLTSEKLFREIFEKNKIKSNSIGFVEQTDPVELLEVFTAVVKT